MNNSNKKQKTITPDMLDNIICDYKNGMSFVELSQKYGFHANSISKKLRKIGLNNTPFYPKISLKEAEELVRSKGYALIVPLKKTGINSQTLHIRDVEDYKYVTSYTNLRNGHPPQKFSLSNPYTVENLNNYFLRERNGEYYCPPQKYTGEYGKLNIIHKSCGETFTTNLESLLGKKLKSGEKYFKNCPKCNNKKTESTHASILKQIFLHEHSDTSLEDRSCINPKTNRALPTDIVNHRLKVVVEIQSSYHDTSEKAEIDEFKKEFWVKKGYSYFAPDIRDYTILEMVQLFFPNINEIPDYIDDHFSDISDAKKIQALLDTGYTVKEATQELNLSPYVIHNWIARGVVILPEENKRRAWNVKELVRLDKVGNFIKRYKHLNDVFEDGFALGTIQRVLRGEQKYSYGSYWVYGKDYDCGNYTLPQIEDDKYDIEVRKINVSTGETKDYKNIYLAAQDSNVHLCEIYRVICGDRKTLKGYRWIKNNK